MLPLHNSNHDLEQMGLTSKSSLIDEKGYPRADVDVYAARHLQHELSCELSSCAEVLNTTT
jgi:hypothetical protein